VILGIFAVGDVRSGSVERVGSGIGEGAQVVAALVDWHFKAGLGKFDGISVISCGILGFPVSIEMARQCKGFSGPN
jgi:hypothetical protein